jgi:hypothetical protein
MAAKKFLRLVSGVLTEIFGVQTSAGVANAGDIPALDDTGRLDASMMPVGVGADTQIITASEALAAGDFVNVWNNSGAKVRKADASVAGKEAHGFVLTAVSNGQPATVYFEGTNTQVTGQTPGKVYLSTTPGQATSTPPTLSGQVVQTIGFATGTTTINFQSLQPVTLA